MGGACPALGFVVGERNAVERHDFKCLSIQLQVQIAVRRGVDHPPELPLLRCDLDSWANGPIHGKDFLGRLRFSLTSLRWDFNLVPESGRIRIMFKGAAAQNDHTLTESPYFGGITFHSLDDE